MPRQQHIKYLYYLSADEAWVQRYKPSVLVKCHFSPMTLEFGMLPSSSNALASAWHCTDWEVTPGSVKNIGDSKLCFSNSFKKNKNLCCRMVSG